MHKHWRSLAGVMTYMFKEKQVKLARMGEVVFGITDGTEEERARKAIVAARISSAGWD